MKWPKRKEKKIKTIITRWNTNKVKIVVFPHGIVHNFDKTQSYKWSRDADEQKKVNKVNVLKAKHTNICTSKYVPLYQIIPCYNIKGRQNCSCNSSSSGGCDDDDDGGGGGGSGGDDEQRATRGGHTSDSN